MVAAMSPAFSPEAVSPTSPFQPRLLVEASRFSPSGPETAPTAMLSSFTSPVKSDSAARFNRPRGFGPSRRRRLLAAGYPGGGKGFYAVGGQGEVKGWIRPGAGQPPFGGKVRAFNAFELRRESGQGKRQGL